MVDMDIVDLFFISAGTVSKVLLIAVTGLVLATQMSGGSNSVKGLSFFVAYVQLPCLLYTKLIDNLSWDSLEKYYPAIFFSSGALAIGYCSGYVARHWVSDKAKGHISLACTFQNAISFPLAILYSVRGVPWLEGNAFEEAVAYIFIYNIPSSICLWGVGATIVRHAVERIAVQEGRQIHVKKTFWEGVLKPMLKTVPIAATIVAFFTCFTPLKYVVGAQPVSTFVAGVRIIADGCVPLQLLVLGCNLMSDATPPKDTSPTEAPKDPSADEEVENRKDHHGNPSPSTSSSEGDEVIVRRTEENNSPPPPAAPAAAADDTNSSRTGTRNQRKTVDSSTQIDTPISSTPTRVAPSIHPSSSTTTGTGSTPDKGLVNPRALGLIVGTVRLAVIPATMLAVMHLATHFGLIPHSNVFVFVILLESCAPSAINVSLLCTIYGYYPRRYTQMLLTCYVCAVFTTTFWMAVHLWYIGRL